MRDDHGTAAGVQDPLQFLNEIEQRAAVWAGVGLEPPQDGPVPRALLLAEYVNALTELMARRAVEPPAEMYTFDEGHAGGCG
ncbi:DUF6269 family protein [Streptomyces sp. MH13]|uniref:DUF6269 family protein n=1 Tax=unclassified Streptomyces TaxID=2593676 RepID=UPI003CF43817